MAEIKTRPATPEYRDNWDRIFAAKQPTGEMPKNAGEYNLEWCAAMLDADFHEKTYESAHA